jgi:protein-S-isoprenylcysteine O-methyltransferase Ste14
MIHVKYALLALLAIAVIGMGVLALRTGLPVWAWLISCVPASAALVLAVVGWIMHGTGPAEPASD